MGHAARATQQLGRVAGQCAVIVGRSRQDGKRRVPCEVPEPAPTRQLAEDVGAHQPDEMGTRKQRAEAAHGVGGVASP